MFHALLILAAAATDLGPEPDGQRMSTEEIRANNAHLTRSHPYYIRCQKREETGSLVKSIRSCRTNAAWERAWQIGNQEARDVMEKVHSKSWNTSG